jgi:hypothetical protein
MKPVLPPVSMLPALAALAQPAKGPAVHVVLISMTETFI